MSTYRLKIISNQMKKIGGENSNNGRRITVHIKQNPDQNPPAQQEEEVMVDLQEEIPMGGGPIGPVRLILANHIRATWRLMLTAGILGGISGLAGLRWMEMVDNSFQGTALGTSSVFGGALAVVGGWVAWRADSRRNVRAITLLMGLNMIVSFMIAYMLRRYP